jgi:alkylation response protein AidB-like acyl-CoA dehydrogenase
LKLKAWPLMQTPDMAQPLATLPALVNALRDLDPSEAPGDGLRHLVRLGLDRVPLPGAGGTLQRWQALAAVAKHDLSLAKLYEGHIDALAILHELGHGITPPADHRDTWGMWGTWAAEVPGQRTIVEPHGVGSVRISGTKCWCSGAALLDHGLLTAWFADGRGPQLVRVQLRQPGLTIDTSQWQAVGMSASSSLDVNFSNVFGELVGGVGHYLSRPGFWQGGAGIAACWYGGALSLADALRSAMTQALPVTQSAFRLAALGKVDASLQAAAAVLREAALWIDAHPLDDARAVALRARLTAEACATLVLAEASRALGAGAFCRDAHFARMAADLPVYVRQSHGEKDFAALGEGVLVRDDPPWLL